MIRYHHIHIYNKLENKSGKGPSHDLLSKKIGIGWFTDYKAMRCPSVSQMLIGIIELIGNEGNGMEFDFTEGTVFARNGQKIEDLKHK